MKNKILWTILLPAFLICAAQPSYGSILIGRITHVEGSVSSYSEDEEGWVEIGTNSPIGAEDGFLTDQASRAELVFPNDTMLRMGEMTEVEILKIEKECTEVYIRGGIVRAYSQTLDTVVKVGTAMGYVEIPPQGTVDFFVDDRSTEIVSLQEDILFHKTVGADAPETYELHAGSNSLIISVRHVETGTAVANTAWGKWCLERDMILKEQAAIRSAHLPSSLRVYSHELEPYGEWERMRYQDYYYWFWRPVHVSVGWSPFVKGRWKRWHHEYVWVSAEPWGWCTHHYGNWVNLHGTWWWTPYVHMGISFPGISLVNFNIHFGTSFRPFWHPGRVAWVSTTSHVGWIPLAPRELYYGCRKWGPRTVVVKKMKRPGNRTHIRHYAYRNHSVIVPQKEFRHIGPKRQHNYGKLKVTGVGKDTFLRDSKHTYGRHKMAGVKQDVRKRKSDSIAKRQQIIRKPNTFKSSTAPARVPRERTLLTPEKKTAFPRKVTGDKAAKVTEKRRPALNRMESGTNKAHQVSTVPKPRQPSINPPYSTRNSLEKPRSEQSTRRSPSVPRTQHIRKNIPTSKSGSAKGNPSAINQNKSPAVPWTQHTRKNTMPSKSGSAKVSQPSQNEKKSSGVARTRQINRNPAPSRTAPFVASQQSKTLPKWTSPQSRQKWSAPSRNPVLRRGRN